MYCTYGDNLTRSKSDCIPPQIIHRPHKIYLQRPLPIASPGSCACAKVALVWILDGGQMDSIALSVCCQQRASECSPIPRSRVYCDPLYTSKTNSIPLHLAAESGNLQVFFIKLKTASIQQTLGDVSYFNSSSP